MWKSLRRLAGLLSRRKRWQAVLLLALLLMNALMEMVGVGLVPVYITILAQPERLLGNAMAADFFAYANVQLDQLSPKALLYWGTGILLGFFTLKLLYSPLLAYVRARYIQALVQSFSTRLLRGYLRAPYAFHLSRNTAELIRNVNIECMQLGMRVLNPLGFLVTHILVAVAISILLMSSIPSAAFVALIAILVLVLPLLAGVNKKIKVLAMQAQQGRKQVIRSVQESLGGVKELRVLQREGYFIKSFERGLGHVLKLQRVEQVMNMTFPVLMEWVAVTTLLLLVFVLYTATDKLENSLALAALVAVSMARLKTSIAGILSSYTQVRASLVSVDVVDHDLKYLETLKGAVSVTHSDPAYSAWPTRPEEIALENVWYRYSDADRWALQGIDLSIRKGEAIGFVGPSGSGKSTLIDTILGILAPDRGTVLADGKDIQQNLNDWHRIVGYVPQAVYLVDGTIQENVALGLGDRDADKEAVARALDAANLKEFVESLPQGLNTVVGERGVRFSGGERQRIAIARALYNNPSILVMDEATSALDNMAEKAVMEAVDSLKGQRTVLMIAHRLSSVRGCDRLVYLREGRVAAVGSYEELLRSDMDFREMAGTA